MKARPSAGAASARVAANVRAWRVRRGMSTYDISRELRALGRPLAANGVLRIEQNDRRVDVDDLLALAVVLGVNVNMLLWPSSVILPSPDGDVEPFELVNDRTVSTPADVRSWVDGVEPLVLLLPDGSRPALQGGTSRAQFRLEAAPYRHVKLADTPVSSVLDG